MVRSALLLIAAALIVTGCTPFTNTATRNAELGWLALDVLDTAQTVTIAKSPGCLYEKSPFAQMVYGTSHPSVGRVIATNTIMASAHWQMGAWLDRNTERALGEGTGGAGAWYAARLSFYTMSFLGTGSAVVGNLRLGIKPATTMRCTP